MSEPAHPLPPIAPSAADAPASRAFPKASLLVIALGTFAIGTDGFAIAGVLPGIAHDLRATLPTAGTLVTAFAVIYAVTAPLLTAAAARIDRRTALVVGMAVLCLSNVAAAVASGYGELMAARVFAAMGAALYSPVALAAAVALSPPERRGRAVATVLAGMTVALVVGVPLGSLLGNLGSWRWMFAFVAAIAAVAALGVGRLLPRVPAAPTSSLASRLALLSRPAVQANLAATFLWIAGAFTVYTYIALVLSRATGAHGSIISVLLLAYGLAALIGNTVGGRAADRWGARRSIVTALASLVISLSAVSYAVRLGPPAGVPLVIIAVMAWAAAGWSLTPAQSHRLVTLVPTAGPEVLSLNTSAVYLGIAAGAAIGGWTITRGGPAALGFTAALLQLLALVLVLAVPAPTSPR